MINTLQKLVILLALVIPWHGHAAEKVDLIIQGDYLITMDGTDVVVRDGAVAVSQSEIVAVGDRSDINSRFIAERVISGKDKVLMPGLINGHTHSSMTLFRGVADDLELMSWLNDYIFPLESKFVNADFVRTGTQLACWEMIRGGTTTFVDMYFYPDTIAEVVDSCGLRAIVAAPSIDFPSPGFSGWDDSFAAAQAFVQRWKGRNSRITPALAPHAPYTVSPEHLQQTVAAAKSLGVPISIHLAESPAEIELVRRQYKDTSVNHVAGLGLLDVPVIGAHMIHLTDDEIQLLVGKQVGAIHNPTSNLKLASGIARVPDMLAAGVLVGLGTDGAASNNDLDLWEEMRLAALIHKQEKQDPTVVPAIAALTMATSGGAAAIGLQNSVGKLRVGMQADMIQVSVASPRLAPLYDLVSHMVYMVDSSDVTTTVVAGRVLMLEGEVLTLDGEKVRQQALAKSKEIMGAVKR
ncbi:MAG: amidohydrolase [Halioglobus sp.]